MSEMDKSVMAVRGLIAVVVVIILSITGVIDWSFLGQR